MFGIKGRINKLENQLGANENPKTLEDIVRKFENGDYGHPSVMAIVVSIHMRGKGDHLKGYPEELINFFIRTMQMISPGQGYRQRQENESLTDYLAYKINECCLVAGAFLTSE